MKKVAYIAGPMSDKPLFNFPAFDACRDELKRWGWEVISPADLDRAVGFDPATSIVSKGFLDEAMERDIEAILRVDAMVMLPGWMDSTGAKAEYALAKWRHIPVYQWPSMEEIVDFPLLITTTEEDWARCVEIDRAACNTPSADTDENEVEAAFRAKLDQGLDELDAASAEYFARDPKAQAGSKKCPMVLLPPIALEEIAWVHQLGSSKYGAFNWRYTGISSDTYISAIMRHLMAIAKGEWLDPESGRPHAAHIACSCNILMDADHHGKLTR